MIHGLELPIQAQDLVKAYQTSTHFRDIYHYITDRKLPSGAKAQVSPFLRLIPSQSTIMNITIYY